MIRFTSMTLRNFLSVGNVTQAMRLDEPGLTLVLGQNMDDVAANSRNGVGKSSILQALCYAIYGQPLTKIRLDNLTNNINGKGMLVTVEFERDGHRYRIERGRKPNVLRFFVDDRDRGETADETQGENRHTQEEIERVVGMSITLFRHLVGLSTYTLPFLKLAAAEQREVGEELLGLTQVGQRAEVLKKKIAATKEAARTAEAVIKATTEANARIETAITRAEQESDAWQRAREQRLLELVSKLEACPSDDDLVAAEDEFLAAEDWDTRSAGYKQAIALKEAEHKRLQAEVTRLLNEAERERAQPVQLFTPMINRIRADISRLKVQIDSQQVPPQIARLQMEAKRKEQEAERRRISAERLATDAAALEAELNNPDSHHCTTCGQGLVGTDHLETVMTNLLSKLENVANEASRELELADEEERAAVAALAEADEVAKAAETRKAADTERLVHLEAELAKTEQDYKAAIDAAEQAAVSFEMDAARISDEVDGIAGDISVANAALKDLGLRPRPRFTSREVLVVLRRNRDALERDILVEEEKEDPYAAQIASLRSTLVEVDYAPLNEHNDTLRHQDFLLKLLTGRDSFLRKRLIDRNLAHLNQRLASYLDGLGLPHQVKFLPDMTVDISLRGREFDYDQLSRGQQGRVTLALWFAFRDVFEGMNVSLNLLFADEVIDNGMDEAGGEAALDVLRRMARERGRSVFLVSHKEGLIGRVNRLLMVRMEDGFTRIDPEGTIEVEAMAA